MPTEGPSGPFWHCDGESGPQALALVPSGPSGHLPHSGPQAWTLGQSARPPLASTSESPPLLDSNFGSPLVLSLPSAQLVIFD